MKKVKVTYAANRATYAYDIAIEVVKIINKELANHGLWIALYTRGNYDDSRVYFEGERARDVRLDRAFVLE